MRSVFPRPFPKLRKIFGNKNQIPGTSCSIDRVWVGNSHGFVKEYQFSPITCTPGDTVVFNHKMVFDGQDWSNEWNVCSCGETAWGVDGNGKYWCERCANK